MMNEIRQFIDGKLDLIIFLIGIIVGFVWNYFISICFEKRRKWNKKQLKGQ